MVNSKVLTPPTLDSGTNSNEKGPLISILIRSESLRTLRLVGKSPGDVRRSVLSLLQGGSGTGTLVVTIGS